MAKKQPPYKIKIYNNVGVYSGTLKFFNILEAFRAYSSIKRAEFFWFKNFISDEKILFSLQILSTVRNENPEYFKKGYNLENGKNEKQKTKNINKTKNQKRNSKTKSKKSK